MVFQLAFVANSVFLLHDTGCGHPERPVRLKAVFRSLGKSILPRCFQLLGLRKAGLRWLENVHSRVYIREFRDVCFKGSSFLHSQDSVVCADSYNAALCASGSVLLAVDWVMNSVGRRAFCAVRPPGHHAGYDRAMGFCFLNHVAVAVRYVQEVYGVGRVCIVDWDAHHGNGTQSIFEYDPTVLFCSIHEDPSVAYPGSGFEEERGKGDGVGFTVNCPIPSGTGEKIYVDLFEDRIVKKIEAFCPEFIFISAGFDAHKDDPLAGLCLSASAYALLTERVSEISKLFCGGRIVSVLEGGYNLPALCESVEVHMSGLLGL